jgi:hypothetical protein
MVAYHYASDPNHDRQKAPSVDVFCRHSVICRRYTHKRSRHFHFTTVSGSRPDGGVIDFSV